MFSEPVTGVQDDDVAVGGTAGATSATVEQVAPNDGTTYRISVGAVTSDGTVTVSLPAGAAEDEAGNPSEASQSSTVHYLSPDLTPPSTEITSGPATVTSSTSASFEFAGTDDRSGITGFECSLDDAAFASCDNPRLLTGRAEGSHTFEVRAIDGAGNVDQTPATRTWTVDTTKPQLNPTVSPSPLWLGAAGTASPGASDPGGSGIASASCGPVGTSTAGDDTVTCTATDNAGNRQGVTIHYLVEYRMLGFFDPVPSSKWKAGQSVPVKIALANGGGALISDTTAAALVSTCRVTFAATGAQQTPAPVCMKYDATIDRFTYSWKLGKSPTGDATISVRVAYPSPATGQSVISERIVIVK